VYQVIGLVFAGVGMVMMLFSEQGGQNRARNVAAGWGLGSGDPRVARLGLLLGRVRASV
jgi:tetrahydromethanopterin S-methyltransferase subunit C